MEGLILGILVVIVVLVLIQFLLDKVGLAEPARGILWIVAIVLSLLWLLGGRPGL